MVERDRFNNGTFAPKSSQVREVRSLRLTNRTWAALGSVAELKGITRADLIEELAANRTIEQSSSDRDEVEKLKEKVLELNAEKEDLLKQLSTSRDGLGLNEIQELRDKVLDSLKMGQQSKPYANAKQAFKEFMKAYFST
jgi:hypothetical protein